ncbi:MAG TPA: hypothetical protein VEH04_08730 [Verrucomicrobiae bacterium]|nr:hypothetical protein [Verrucomicrobiae bacterium]
MVSEQSYRNGAILVFLLVTALATTLWFLPNNQGVALTTEGSLIESLSVAVIAAGAVGAAWKATRSHPRLWIAVAVLFCWMFLRELDYQKMFTVRSIESIGFYSNPRVPIATKLIALAALAPFVLAGVYLALKSFRLLKRLPALRRFWLPPAVCAMVLAAIALAVEKLLGHKFQIVEECAELGIACLIVFVALRSHWPEDMDTRVRPSRS